MRGKIVIANWKMNLSVPESTVLLEKYLYEINPKRTEVIVCPSFLDIYSAEKVLQGSKIKVGSQDIFYEDEGSYTGEVSPKQLTGFVEYTIVGHSERRKNFGETDKIVAKKAATAVRHKIAPIVCVGENLHEKMDGLTKLVVTGQLEACLSDLTSKEIGGIIVAYEPVWAIGTGHVCDPKVANEVARNIRNLIRVLFGQKAADRVHIVYGGSLDSKNIGVFLSQPDLDGFLVGGASLDHKEFSEIVARVDVGPLAKAKPSPKTSSKNSRNKKTSKNKK
ncbi:MAG: triose-phosphate isomerase [Patescibacteria group bacterium]|nr:triose-phosphate isomerase [Patescibacteria group bacterium]